MAKLAASCRIEISWIMQPAMIVVSFVRSDSTVVMPSATLV